MARYVANTEQILALVDKARRIGRQFEQRIAEVEHEIAALHVDWQGDAADAHRSKAATWHREMTDMQTALAALETAAHSAHDGYIANVEHNMGDVAVTTPITMDSTLLADAAELYATAQASGQEVITTLAAALDAHWGCAGSDSAGATWAASYDPAAFDAVAAGTDLVNACGKMHDLLAFTALNHANTEKANENPPEPPDGPPPQLPTSTSPTFKGAFGGDTDEPFGWGLVSSWLQGHTWPNGDPDKLRALGDEWRAAATGLRSAADGTGSVFPLLEAIVSGEIPQALAQMDLVFTDTEQVATQYESLAASCRDWADTIEDAHHKILAILAGALGAGLIIGGIAGFFTAGTGAAAAAGAAGSAAGASIVTVLVAFDTAAAVAVGATPPPVSRSAEWPPTYNPCSKQTPPCSTRAPAEAEAEAHTTTSRHRRTCQDSRTHGP